MSQLNVSFDDIKSAHTELSKLLPPCPLLLNPWLSEAYDCQVYLKLENMQPVGSFKIRGATYRIQKLTDAEKKRGVIAASAGNHAQGVAWGSRRLGVSALIVMPTTAPLTKIERTRRLGAEIVFEGETYDAANEAATRIAKETGRVFISAFEDEDVIAGQGTCGIEIVSQLPHTDWVIGAIGGGGWMAGVSIAMKHLSPKTKLVGVQAEGCAPWVESMKTKKTATRQSKTYCDGIAVETARQSMVDLLAPYLEEVVAVDDETTAEAILDLMEKARVVAEGAGAVSLGALPQLRKKIKGKKVVVLISGGNIDVNLVGRVIDRGLIQSGRRMRVNLVISDRPGSLSGLTEAIANEGASVLQVIHDRNDARTHIDETGVLLTLETRGPEHCQELQKALKKHSLRFELQD